MTNWVVVGLSMHLGGCQLFAEPQSATPENPHADPRLAQAKAEVHALADRCKHGDDKGCAELFDNPHAGMHNLIATKYGSDTSHDNAMLLVGRCCAGGSASACVLQKTLEAQDEAKVRMAEYKASLAIVTAAEISAIQPGWSLQQVERTVGQPCRLQTRNVYTDPSTKRDVDRATYHCSNSDSSGVHLVFLDGEVREISVAGRPPA